MDVNEATISSQLGVLRVLEIGDDPALAYCGLQFARWGAQVLVAEQFVGSLPDQSPAIEGHSLSWLYQTANKTIVQEDIGSLAASADIVLSTLSLEELKEHHIEPGSDTIFHRVLPYATGGIFEAMDGSSLLFEAISGFLSINGAAEREPLRMPANLVSFFTGVSASVATLAALLHRLNTGCVEQITSSQLDALTCVVPFVRSQYVGDAEQRHGGPATGVRLHPIGSGRVSGNLADPHVFDALLESLGIDSAQVPPSLLTVAGRQDTRKLNEFLREVTKLGDAEEVFMRVMHSGAPRFGLYQNAREVHQNEQVRALDFFQHVDHNELRTVNLPGLPARFPEFSFPKVQLARRSKRRNWSGPKLGSRTGSKSAMPLAGVRIVDFTQAWIGPFAAMMLADLGAEVIKVESHHRVDVWRNWRGDLASLNLRNPEAHPYNVSPNFNSTNRGKKAVAIDLTHSEGVEAAIDLIRTADVVMSNFTPRVMQKYGLDYESLKQINRTIVSVSWSGYGTTGPYGDFKANGATVEALAGWDSLFGYTDDEPMVMGFYQCDAFCGMQMAAYTLLALINRELTGASQSVEGSMLETALGYIGEHTIAGQISDSVKRWGNRHPDYSPHGVFPTIEPNEWVVIVCKTDQEWQTLSRILGLTDTTYDNEPDRIREAPKVEEMVSNWTQSRSRDEIVSTLMAASLNTAPVLNTQEILVHQGFIKRSWFKEQHHPDIGDTLHAGFPWRFSESELQATLPPPRLGEHTHEVLQSIGYSDTRIAQLFKDDVIGAVLGKQDSYSAN